MLKSRRNLELAVCGVVLVVGLGVIGSVLARIPAPAALAKDDGIMTTVKKALRRARAE
jgi:hypothetical protein